MNKAHLNLGTTLTKTTHGRNRWTLACLALLGALCLVVLAGSYRPSYALDPPQELKAKELSSLQTRVKALGNKTGGLEWAQVVKDFDAWAKKYAVKVETQSQAATAAPPGGWTPCRPTRLCGPHCYCILVPSEPGVCRYKCYWY